VATSARPGCSRLRDGGSVSLETVILFPIVLFVSVGAIQLGLWFYARSVCMGAAQEAVRAAAAYSSTVAVGQAAGELFLGQVGRGLVSDTAVTVVRPAGGAVVKATVTARGLSLFEAWPVEIVEWAELPIEQETT
jgi:Flp pilus assembly protein TadG